MKTGIKLKKLRAILEDMGSALLAFSGGADSAFLLAAGAGVFKGRFLAVTGVSGSITKPEVAEAVSLAKRFKVEHKLVRAIPPQEFRDNPPQRCYYCKKALFGKLKKLAGDRKINWVIDAANADDSADYRPGTKAVKELGVRSPLKEAGLTKREIRAVSRRMGIEVWNKPAAACLASRIPYGEKITPEKLRMVAQAEEFLRKSGFAQVRVRLHGNVGRVEVEPGKMISAVKMAGKISRKLRSLGIAYSCVDLEGYRCGSLNEVLGWKKKK